MAILLDPQTLRIIEEKMKQGGFSSADDFVRAAVMSLEERDSLRSVPDAELEIEYPNFRRKIAEGLAEANAGKLTDGEVFFAELEREEDDFDRKDRKIG